MRIDSNFLELLRSLFVSRRGPSTIVGTLSPSVNQGADLGESFRRFDRIFARAVIADSVQAGGSSLANADTLDGYHADLTPTADTLLPLDSAGVFPDAVTPNAVLRDGSRALTGELQSQSSLRLAGGLVVGSQAIAPSTGVLAGTKHLELAQQGTAPGSPASGWGRWYEDSAGVPMHKNAGGVTANLETDEIDINIQGCYYTGATGTGAITNWYWCLRDIPNNTTEPDPQVYFNWACPPSWAGKVVYLDVWWLPSDATSGNVRWELVWRQAKPGVDWTTAAWMATAVSATSGSTNLPVCTTLSFTLPSNIGKDTNMLNYIIRNGNAADDTYTKKVYLMGIRLRIT